MIIVDSGLQQKLQLAMFSKLGLIIVVVCGYVRVFVVVCKHCSRCCDKKSCGNRNETPSDPVVIDRSVAYTTSNCKLS